MNKLPIITNKKVIVNRPGLKVVHFHLSAGDVIPEHKTNVDVVATTVKGKGIFIINGAKHEMSPGVVLEMGPATPHSIKAIEELEFVVVHARLANKTEDIHCGALNPTSSEPKI
jgi:quercetin dioxygenase-like cupin family protein